MVKFRFLGHWASQCPSYSAFASEKFVGKGNERPRARGGAAVGPGRTRPAEKIRSQYENCHTPTAAAAADSAGGGREGRPPSGRGARSNVRGLPRSYDHMFIEVTACTVTTVTIWS